MKEVQIISWCDNHDEGVQVPATVERIFSIDDSGTYTVDLCKECDASVFDHLWYLMDQGTPGPGSKKKRKASAKTKAPSRRRGAVEWTTEQLTCPDCEMVSASREALGQHVRKQHNKGLKDYPSLRVGA